MITLGISACVLGNPVRFDGGHKRSGFVCNELAKHFEFMPLCPEQAIGMGVPRPTIRLVGNPEAPRVIGSKDTRIDVTDALSAYSERTIAGLGSISGYILCAKSPSCGMERVPVYTDQGDNQGKIGVGVFARALMKARPELPIEEDGRLCDPLLRENFVLRVVAFNRWQEISGSGMSSAQLQTFHRAHKYLLLAHNQPLYRQLGPLVANATDDDIDASAQRYIALFMKALAKPASRKNHTNVLMHLQGYFKNQLSPVEKQELTETIHHYREGIVPLMSPLTLINYLLQRHPMSYLSEQTYLNPYPKDLRLRYGL